MAYSTTTGWYRFGSTASPIATGLPVRVTAFTYFACGPARNGDAGKLRPLRTCAAVRSSTNTLGKAGSNFSAGTNASDHQHVFDEQIGKVFSDRVTLVGDCK
jgi:hypothetical protein